MKAGLSEREARRRASLELGGVPQVQEAVRDTWIWRWFDTLMRDVRYARRSLTRSWGFALGAAPYSLWPSGQASRCSPWSTRSCFSPSPTPTPGASSRSRRCGPTPDARARRYRSRLHRLASAERRVREDGCVLRWRRFRSHRRQPRRVCQRPVRVRRVLRGLRPDRVCGTPADGARYPRRRRGADDRRRAVSLGRGALRQRRGRHREDDHRVRQPAGDCRSGGAGISLSRRR